MKKVIPFSNATEAMDWMDRNCEYCTTSTGCSAKKNIELGFITGNITVKAAEFIGICTKYFQSNYVELYLECQNMDKRIIKSYKKKIILVIYLCFKILFVHL